jgi:hypothetical protein
VIHHGDLAFKPTEVSFFEAFLNLVDEITVLKQAVPLSRNPENSGESLIPAHRSEKPGIVTVNGQRFQSDREREVAGMGDSLTSHSCMLFSIRSPIGQSQPGTPQSGTGIS